MGRTEYCNFPESIQDVAVVGGTSEPNVETIIGLNPDLVLGATHTSQEVIEKLREVGIPVAFLNEESSIADTYQAINLVGELVNEVDQAEFVVDEMTARIEAVTTHLEGVTELPSVYYALWYGDSDSTATGATFIGELMRLAGGENIAEDAEGWSISREVIAARDPEIIIVEEKPDMTLEEEIKQLQEMPFYQDLTAVKEGNVFAVDGDMIARQGPRLVGALEELAHILHPEVMASYE